MWMLYCYTDLTRAMESEDRHTYIKAGIRWAVSADGDTPRTAHKLSSLITYSKNKEEAG